MTSCFRGDSQLGERQFAVRAQAYGNVQIHMLEAHVYLIDFINFQDEQHQLDKKRSFSFFPVEMFTRQTESWSNG